MDGKMPEQRLGVPVDISGGTFVHCNLDTYPQQFPQDTKWEILSSYESGSHTIESQFYGKKGKMKLLMSVASLGKSS